MAFGQRQGSYSRYREYFLKLSLLYNKPGDIRMFIELALSLATLSFFLFFVLRPTVLTITQLFKDVNTKEETIKQLDEKIQNLNTAQNIMDRERKNIEKLDSAIPNGPLPDKFIRQIESIAQKNGSPISALTVDEVTLIGKEGNFKPIERLPEGTSGLNISISLTGNNYQPLISFLSDLENTRRPLLLDSVSLNSVIIEKDQQSLLMTIVGRVPFLVLKEGNTKK